MLRLQQHKDGCRAEFDFEPFWTVTVCDWSKGGSRSMCGSGIVLSRYHTSVRHHLSVSHSVTVMYLDSVLPQLIKSIKSWQMVFTHYVAIMMIISGIKFQCGIPGRCDNQHFFHFTKYQILCYTNMPTMIIRCTRCHVRSMVWIELSSVVHGPAQSRKPGQAGPV